MIKRARFIIIVILAVLFMPDSLFAVRSEFETMTKLEEKEKSQIQEKMVRPLIEYKSKGLRDPFQTPFEKQFTLTGTFASTDLGAVSLSFLKLQGVVWGGKFPQAIINDRVVKIGDAIEGALIVDINKEGVVLFLDGKEYKLSSPVSEISTHKKSGGEE